jgi:HK97 gp10 family phage protein
VSARIEWDGLEDLIRKLTDAPREIREEGFAILKESTEQCAAEIAQRYPKKTGAMSRRLRTIYPSTQVLVGVIQSTAPHAHLVEFGTQQRRTDKGYNRGKMPPADPQVVVPAAQKHRARMYQRIKEMLIAKGFELSET